MEDEVWRWGIVNGFFFGYLFPAILLLKTAFEFDGNAGFILYQPAVG
jgi:hypothetical protein